MSVNQVIIIGRLGCDPEGRSFKDGGMLSYISVATTESWKDKFGNKQEHTEWHRIVLHNKMADFSMANLRKGSSVYIEGSIKYRRYEDMNKLTRYITEIEAKSIQSLE